MERPSIPWKSIWTSVPMIALIITHFGQNWGFLTVLTLMPTYFKDVLDLDIKDNGLWSSLPWLLQAICAWLASVVGDKLRQSGRLPVNVIRKVSNSIGKLDSCLLGIGRISVEMSRLGIFRQNPYLSKKFFFFINFEISSILNLIIPN